MFMPPWLLQEGKFSQPRKPQRRSPPTCACDSPAPGPLSTAASALGHGAIAESGNRPQGPNPIALAIIPWDRWPCCARRAANQPSQISRSLSWPTPQFYHSAPTMKLVALALYVLAYTVAASLSADGRPAEAGADLPLWPGLGQTSQVRGALCKAERGDTGCGPRAASGWDRNHAARARARRLRT